MRVNPPALHGGISQVNPSHWVSDEKNAASHTQKCVFLVLFLSLREYNPSLTHFSVILSLFVL